MGERRKSIKIYYEVSYSEQLDITSTRRQENADMPSELSLTREGKDGLFIHQLSICSLLRASSRSFSSPALLACQSWKLTLVPSPHKSPQTEGFRRVQEAAFIWQPFGQGSGIMGQMGSVEDLHLDHDSGTPEEAWRATWPSLSYDLTVDLMLGMNQQG